MINTITQKIINGVLTPVTTIAAAESVQESGTHVGTASGDFSVMYNGVALQIRTNQIFIADAGLYAVINASPASSSVTWSN
jgi:hypothetical protein